MVFSLRDVDGGHAPLVTPPLPLAFTPRCHPPIRICTDRRVSYNIETKFHLPHPAGVLLDTGRVHNSCTTLWSTSNRFSIVPTAVVRLHPSCYPSIWQGLQHPGSMRRRILWWSSGPCPCWRRWSLLAGSQGSVVTHQPHPGVQYRLPVSSGNSIVEFLHSVIRLFFSFFLLDKGGNMDVLYPRETISHINNLYTLRYNNWLTGKDKTITYN